MKFKEINYNKIRIIISKMKQSNSASYDQITSNMLKKGKNTLIPIILKMVNNSIIQKKVSQKSQIFKNNSSL